MHGYFREGGRGNNPCTRNELIKTRSKPNRAKRNERKIYDCLACLEDPQACSQIPTEEHAVRFTLSGPENHCFSWVQK